MAATCALEKASARRASRALYQTRPVAEGSILQWALRRCGHSILDCRGGRQWDGPIGFRGLQWDGATSTDGSVMALEKLGPYKLEKLLGRGGMGAVYVAVHETTRERAAVKVLSGHLADDPAFRERFKQEIDALKLLLHPNIVQLFGYGEEQGHLYYVMELVEGRNVQDELTAGRRFNWREVARIGIGIAQALKHAHDRGIIHRDLK